MEGDEERKVEREGPDYGNLPLSSLSICLCSKHTLNWVKSHLFVGINATLVTLVNVYFGKYIKDEKFGGFYLLLIVNNWLLFPFFPQIALGELVFVSFSLCWLKSLLMLKAQRQSYFNLVLFNFKSQLYFY